MQTHHTTNTMTPQTTTTPPYQFIFCGYMCRITGAQRFGGYQFTVQTIDGTYTLYARRAASGALELFTGAHLATWYGKFTGTDAPDAPAGYAPQWRELWQLSLDDVVLYPLNVEKTRLDVFNMLD